MTKYELRQYRDISREIEQLREQQAGLIRLVKEHDGQPRGSGISDPTGKAGATMATISSRIDDLLVRLLELRDEIERAIEHLPPRERMLMRYYYIDCMTWEQVAERMHYSRQHTLRLHGSILGKLKDETK